MGNESSSTSSGLSSTPNVGEMCDNIMNIGPQPGPLDPGYVDRIKYDLNRQREEFWRPKSVEEIVHKKICDDIGWTSSGFSSQRSHSPDHFHSSCHAHHTQHHIRMSDPFDKQYKSFFNGMHRTAPYKKAEYKPPTQSDPGFFRPGAVVKDEATNVFVAGWKEKDTRTQSEFKIAVNKFKESLADSVAINSATNTTTGSADIIGAVIDAIDPIERSDTEQLVRGACSVIPVVNVLEKIERIMEIQVHREIEYFKVVKQEFLNAGYSDKDAEYWAYKTTSVD